MQKIYGCFGFCFLMLCGFFTSQPLLAQKPDRDGDREHLRNWPRQKITHRITPIGPPQVINFKALADSELAHPPVIGPKRSVDQNMESVEEKFHYKPKRVPRTAPVFQVAHAPAAARLPEAPAPIASFNGVLSNSTEIPPDIQGAAGPTYVMETTNQQYQIFNKTGGTVSTLQLTSFYGSVSTTLLYDPHILYDPIYSKFIAIADAGLSDGNSGFVIAVSETSDPTGNWYVYGYDTQLPFDVTNNNFVDYPELGYNNNWVVITGNYFQASGITGEIYVFNRASLYSGTIGTVDNFSDNNAFTWVPAQTYDAAEDTEFMVQGGPGDQGGSGYMQVGMITGTAASPSYNAGNYIGVAQTWSTTAVDASQMGSGNGIDPGDTRVMNGVVYISKSLWFTHNVFLPAGNPTYIGADWWQIEPSALNLLQYGRVADVNGNTNYFYPNLNVNSQGDALLGYCVSGADSFYASAGYSFHAGADAANTMQSRYIYKNGVAGYYSVDNSGRNRWGDFTGTAVDPTDNSFWTFGQWAETGNNWGTQIAHIGPSVVITSPPVANFVADSTTSNCSGVIQFTDLSTNVPTSWLWNFGDGTTSTLQNPEHTYGSNGTYTVTLTATNSYGSNTKTSTNYITISKPAGPTANNQINCGSSSFSLSANTTNPVAWFDSSGNEVGTTNPFVTPVLSHTTTYWVQDTFVNPIDSVGPATNTTLGTGGYFSNSTDRYLLFNALSKFEIISVTVNAENAGTRTIALRAADTVTLQSVTVNLAAGNNVVPLNFIVPAGTNYQLAINGTANLYRNNAGTGTYYPFTVPGMVSITGSNAGSGYYYYFYNWKVSAPPPECVSNRTAVTATVGNSIALNPSVTNVLCNGGSNGSILLAPTGGTPAYHYHWSTGSTANPLTGVAAGLYEVTVTDASGCSVQSLESVGQPTLLTANTSATNSQCGTATGTATVTASGGTTNYTYHWGTGATTATISSIASGAYPVTVTDAHSCTATAQASVGNSGGLNLSTSSTAVKCYGGSTGTATATVTGDTHTVNYNWSSGATTATASNLAAGTATVTVSDITGCSATGSQTITQPSAINISVTGVNAGCGGTGAATATPSGGTGTYSYSWNTGATTSGITGLAVGTYHVTVTDANNCTATNSVSIINGSSLNLSVTPQEPSCFGGSNGQATAAVTGDPHTISYNWSSGATTATATNLAAGTYTVSANDGAGCSATASTTVTQPSAVSVTISSVNPGCGQTNGTATAQPLGGTGAYTYHWNGGGTTAEITGLSAASYHVSVDDANSCSASASVTLVNGGSLSLSITTQQPSCFGGSNGQATATVTGDPHTISYNWSSGATTATAPNLRAGTYTVSASDGTGCSAVGTANVTQPTAITININSTNATCGQSNGTATAQPTGGTGSYSYNWTGGSTTAMIQNLTAGTYAVTVTDANHCTSSNAVNIISSSSLVANINSTNELCHGASTGSAQVNVSGGSSPFIYAWSNGATASQINNLASGNYIVTITDHAHCTKIDTVSITQPTLLGVLVIYQQPACNGGSGGIASAGVTGGTPGYSYLWSNGGSTDTIQNLTAGTYSITVHDFNNCSTSSEAVINNPAAINPNLSSSNDSCYGSQNGSVQASPTGGAGGFSFVWSNGSTTSAIGTLSSGTYHVTITDAHNCTATAVATVTEPSQIQFTTTTTLATAGQNNGTAIVNNPTGGTSPYSFIWSNGETGNPVSGLAAGTYTVTVKDENGCEETATIKINGVTGITGVKGELQFSIYPNPSTGDIIVEFDATQGKASITVNDILGQTVVAKETETPKTHINLSNFADGVYMVTLKQGDKQSVKQVIVSR